MNEDLVYRLRKRAEIRRQIPDRKSVQEGKPDRIADLLEEAATEIEDLKAWKDNAIEQLVVTHIYREEHQSNPRLALIDLIDYHMSIAIDPQVSEPAQRLMDMGKVKSALFDDYGFKELRHSTVAPDRIKQLCFEADDYCDKYFQGSETFNHQWEMKFANLIIKEIESYIKDSEGDIDYVRFLIDRNLK